MWGGSSLLLHGGAVPKGDDPVESRRRQAAAVRAEGHVLNQTAESLKVQSRLPGRRVPQYYLTRIAGVPRFTARHGQAPSIRAKGERGNHAPMPRQDMHRLKGFGV